MAVRHSGHVFGEALTNDLQRHFEFWSAHLSRQMTMFTYTVAICVAARGCIRLIKEPVTDFAGDV
jgi:hypothetical protein